VFIVSSMGGGRSIYSTSIVVVLPLVLIDLTFN
jgi:hypothetical protein